MASRAVFLTAGFILLICGVVGKIGAVLTLIPDPVIGGNLTVMLAMVFSVGISTVKFIDIDSTRNLTILGTSIIVGLMVPQYINDPANANLIDTGKLYSTIGSCLMRKMKIKTRLIGTVHEN